MRVNVALRISMVCVLAAITSSLSAQGWKDLLNQVTESTGIDDLVDDLLGTNSPTDISGKWTFKGSAIMLESDDFLKEMAGDAVAATAAEKLDTYLEEIGLKAGTFNYTFSADSTFTNQFKTKALQGTYSLRPSNNGICLSYSRTLSFLKLEGIVERNGNSLKLVFPADKLLKFLETISKSSKNQTLIMLGELAENYDGMNIGFHLVQ